MNLKCWHIHTYVKGSTTSEHPRASAMCGSHAIFTALGKESKGFGMQHTHQNGKNSCRLRALTAPNGLHHSSRIHLHSLMVKCSFLMVCKY